MERTVVQAARGLWEYPGKKLAMTGVCAGLMVGAMAHVDDPIFEPTAKKFAEIATDAYNRIPGVPDITLPWRNDHNTIGTQQRAGHLALSENLGAFVIDVEARTSMKGNVLDRTVSESKTMLEGRVVSRIKVPGITVLDTLSDDDVMYVTMYGDPDVAGKQLDLGIPIGKATFEMLRPDTATDSNGQADCGVEETDITYTGCIEAGSIRVGFLAWFLEDRSNNLQLAGEMLFDEYSKIEECHFDNIFIPAFNEIYAANQERIGGLKQIDGPGAYTEVMKIFFRYFQRAELAEQVPPQRIFFKFAPDSEYVPTPSVIDRIQDRAAEVDFTFELGEDIEPNYCVEGSNGTLDVAVAGNADLKNALIRIAIGGMEQVPAGFNIKTGQFEEGKFARPSLDTTMGPVIKDLLGGN